MNDTHFLLIYRTPIEANNKLHVSLNGEKSQSAVCHKLVMASRKTLVLDPLFAISIGGSYHYRRGLDSAWETAAWSDTNNADRDKWGWTTVQSARRHLSRRECTFRALAARIIIRFYYRLTIGRDAVRLIESRLGRRHVRKQTMVSGSPDRRFAEEKGDRNSAGNCAAADVTVAVNSVMTSATDFIIDVARVTYKDQLVVESLRVKNHLMYDVWYSYISSFLDAYLNSFSGYDWQIALLAFILIWLNALLIKYIIPLYISARLTIYI